MMAWHHMPKIHQNNNSNKEIPILYFKNYNISNISDDYSAALKKFRNKKNNKKMPKEYRIELIS